MYQPKTLLLLYPVYSYVCYFNFESYFHLFNVNVTIFGGLKGQRDTAGLPIRYLHTKNQFADEPEGLRQFLDHRWKALGKENSDLL